MTDLLKQFLLPPSSLIFLLLIGLVLARKRWDISWSVAALSAGLLFLLATPLVADAIAHSLESYPPLPADGLSPDQAQAIVILGSDSAFAAETGGDTVGPLTLVRLRYGARLHRLTHLPILLSGGVLDGNAASLADYMDRVLVVDYGIMGSWLEPQSRDTWENAVDSSALLRANHVQRIYLVTHARDMARALRAFRQNGIDVIPAPVAFDGRTRDGIGMFLPSTKSLLVSNYLLYEIAGGLWYRLRH